MDRDAPSLAERLRVDRGCGDVEVVALESTGSIGVALEQLARAAHLRPVGRSWRPLSTEAARERIADALQWDLATGARVFDPARAAQEAAALVATMPAGTWYATSERPLDPAWLATTQVTLELGFAVLDGDDAAIAVVRGGKHSARFLAEGEMLMERIRGARQSGDVNVAVAERDGGEPDAVLWAAGLSAGCDRVVGEDEARAILVGALARDLAYDMPVLDPAQAEAFVDQLFALLPGDRCFSTNRTGNSWAPVTVATFDVAVRVVTPGRCGVLAIMDED